MRRALMYIGRPLRIAWLTSVLAAAFFFRRLGGPTAGPRVVRWYCQKCGGAFVKIGQFLALRYDLLPTAYCEELSKLLDSLPPSPTQEVIATICDELGRPLHASFPEFEMTPVASASIAQVHRAALPDGRPVAVKVKHKGMRERFEVDFFNLRILALLIDYSGILRGISAVNLAMEFIRQTREEFDFRHEARNAQILHDLLEADELDHYAPEVYHDFSSASVLTLERLEGVWINDVLSAINNGDAHQLAMWEQDGISLKRTARLVMRSILLQTYRHRVFHGDPHPANMVILKGGTLGYVDFGIVGWLDERDWAVHFKLRSYIAHGMIDAAYDSLLDALEPLPNRDLTRFKIEAKNVIREYVLSTQSASVPLREKSSGYFYLRMFAILRKWRLRFPSSISSVYRAVIVVDAIMLRLHPEINWLPDLKEFVQRETLHQVDSILNKGYAVTALSTLLINLQSAPQVAGNAIHWAQHRLPELGRRYERQISMLEQITMYSIQYIKRAAWLIVLVVTGAQYGEEMLPVLSGPSGTINALLGDMWLVVAIGAALVALTLSRLLRRANINL